MAASTKLKFYSPSSPHSPIQFVQSRLISNRVFWKDSDKSQFSLLKVEKKKHNVFSAPRKNGPQDFCPHVIERYNLANG